MLELLTLLLSALSDEAEGHDRRGRLHELRGRLGLRQEVVRGGPEARIAWALREHPDMSESRLLRALRLAGVRASGDPSTIDGLIPTIARWLDKERSPMNFMLQMLRPIRDWWLATDTDLSRISWFEAIQAAMQWHDDLAQGLVKAAGQRAPPGEVVYSWNDGWTVHRLQDPTTIRIEGASMQNCLAEGIYDEDIELEWIELYSLRGPPDARGWSRPAVTMARGPDAGRFFEIKGRQNEPPAKKYRSRVLDFLIHLEGPALYPDHDNIVHLLERGRPGFEKMLTIPELAYEYAKLIDRGPADDTRAAVMKDAGWAYLYAKDIDKQPSDDTRSSALHDPEYAYWYASEIDKQPRDDTRKAAMQRPYLAVDYARFIDRGPRDDTRAAALKDPRSAYKYARFIDRQPQDDTRSAAYENQEIRQLYQNWERDLDADRGEDR